MPTPRPRIAWPMRPPRRPGRRGAGRACRRTARAGGRVRRLRAAACAAATGSTSATRSAWRCGCCASTLPSWPRSAAGIGTSWSTSSRTRTTPSGSSSSCSPPSTATSRWSATTTRASTASAARPWATSSASGPRTRRRRSVVLVDNYRSRQPILDAAHRLIRHNDPERLEAREGIDKRLRARAKFVRPEPRDRADRAARLHDRLGRGRCHRRPHRRLDRAPAAGRRSRHPGPRQPRRRSVPARPQHGAHPVAIQRDRRALPPARGAGPHQLPARGERPGRLGQPLRPGDQRDLRPGAGRRHAGAEPRAPPTQQPRRGPARRGRPPGGLAVRPARDRGRPAPARQPGRASGHEHRAHVR